MEKRKEIDIYYWDVLNNFSSVIRGRQEKYIYYRCIIPGSVTKCGPLNTFQNFRKWGGLIHKQFFEN